MAISHLPVRFLHAVLLLPLNASSAASLSPSDVYNESPEPRLVFIFDIWHPSLRTDEQRLAALDAAAKTRYQRTVASLRAGMGLPMEADLVADRRRRTIY